MGHDCVWTEKTVSTCNCETLSLEFILKTFPNTALLNWVVIKHGAPYNVNYCNTPSPNIIIITLPYPTGCSFQFGMPGSGPTLIWGVKDQVLQNQYI